MAKRSVRLHVNGVYYVITDVPKYTTYKDLLCILVNRNENKFFEDAETFGGKDKSQEPLSRARRSGFLERKKNQSREKKSGNRSFYNRHYQSIQSKKTREEKDNQMRFRNENEETRFAMDDSDVESYHRSKRKLKNIMERKLKDESDTRNYTSLLRLLGHPVGQEEKLELGKASKSNDGLEKISIYYIDEPIEKLGRHDPLLQCSSRSRSTTLSSGGGSPACHLSEERRGNLVHRKKLDDVDSGVPSWESEEHSSRDESKQCFERETTCTALDRSESFEKTCLTLNPTESVSQSLFRENFSENAKKMEQCSNCRKKLNCTSGAKLSNEIEKTGIEVKGSCCLDNRGNKDFPLDQYEVKERSSQNEGADEYSVATNSGNEEADATSDFEEIKTDVHLANNNFMATVGNSLNGLNDTRCNKVQLERPRIVYDVNGNVIDSCVPGECFNGELNIADGEGLSITKRSGQISDCKISVENRGSFILIDVDEASNEESLLGKGASSEYVTESENKRTLNGNSKLLCLQESLKSSSEKKVRMEQRCIGTDLTDIKEQKETREKDCQNYTNSLSDCQQMVSCIDDDLPGLGVKLPEEQDTKENMSRQADMLNVRDSGGCQTSLARKDELPTTNFDSVKYSKGDELTLVDTIRNNEEKDEKAAIWGRYIEVCKKVREICEKLLVLELILENKKFELKEIDRGDKFYEDDVIERDEKIIVKDLIEFRKHLKKVTLTSRKQRKELGENRVELAKMDAMLMKKQKFLQYLERQATIKFQNIPRRLLKHYNERKKNAK